jgi:riboflavin synthase
VFTGIIQHLGTVTAVEDHHDRRVLSVDAGPIGSATRQGESVSVDGVCLTAAAAAGPLVRFDVTAETLRLTTLGRLHPGDRVNVEPALRVGDRLGGHFVSGHVDGLGTISAKDRLPGEVRLAVRTDPALLDQMVLKGSVAVDGVSLTIAALDRTAFVCSLIPHTLSATTLGLKTTGQAVNVECDMIGRWVKRWLTNSAGPAPDRKLTIEMLEDQGF